MEGVEGIRPNGDRERLEAAAAEAAGAVGARLVVLFGSAARDPASARDLDLGFLAPEPLDTVALTNRLTRALGTQAVDVADLLRADPVLMAAAARGGVPLYEAGPGEFARFFSLALRRFADTRKFREAERREIEAFLEARESG